MSGVPSASSPQANAAFAKMGGTCSGAWAQGPKVLALAIIPPILGREQIHGRRTLWATCRQIRHLVCLGGWVRISDSTSIDQRAEWRGTVPAVHIAVSGCIILTRCVGTDTWVVGCEWVRRWYQIIMCVVNFAWLSVGVTTEAYQFFVAN